MSFLDGIIIINKIYLLIKYYSGQSVLKAAFSNMDIDVQIKAINEMHQTNIKRLK